MKIIVSQNYYIFMKWKRVDIILKHVYSQYACVKSVLSILCGGFVFDVGPSACVTCTIATCDA